MDFDRAATELKGIPYTPAAKGRFFYNLVLERRPKRILELGFAHGVGTCYFAAAAEEIGNCEVHAVDLEQSASFEPKLEDLASRLKLDHLIRVERETSSYTWFLKRTIAEHTKDHVCVPQYDLVFIDGPKDWTNDGCAFFLADKLLRPEGTILFDDYSWSYRGHEAQTGRKYERGYIFEKMSEQEFAEPQVKAIFELLVMQHPGYSNFEVVDGDVAMARKTEHAGPKELIINTRYSLRHRVVSRIAKLARGLNMTPAAR